MIRSGNLTEITIVLRGQMEAMMLHCLHARRAHLNQHNFWERVISNTFT